MKLLEQKPMCNKKMFKNIVPTKVFVCFTIYKYLSFFYSKCIYQLSYTYVHKWLKFPPPPSKWRRRKASPSVGRWRWKSCSSLFLSNDGLWGEKKINSFLSLRVPLHLETSCYSFILTVVFFQTENTADSKFFWLRL